MDAATRCGDDAGSLMTEPNMEELMTETEYLLRTAREIAARELRDPSEAAVLAVFAQLCEEAGRAHGGEDEVRVLH